MKRLRIVVSVCMVAVLLLGLVACAKPSSPIEGEQGAVPMPDFPVASRDADGTVSYAEVSVAAYNQYLELLGQEGFEKIGPYWCREDVWLAVRHWHGEDMALTVQQLDGALTADKEAYTAAQALTKRGDDAVLAMLEQSPDRFYEKTGAQWFLALVSEWNEESLEITYTTQYYLVGKKNQLLVSAVAGPVVADVDGDGRHEIVTASYGPTSGLSSVSLNVYAVEDGEVRELSSVWHVNYSLGGLEVDEEGTVWLIGRSESDTDGRVSLLWENGCLVPSDFD